MNLDYIEIGKRIRKYRKTNGLSQDELAEMVNISTTHMSHIETANTKLSLLVCASIANALHVRIDDIIYDSPSDYSKTKDEIMEELSDCNDSQIKALKDILVSSKIAIKKYL